jgi:uncharacterized protein YbaA (DUF1428 family)
MWGVDMNIFVLDKDPAMAAKYMDDVRLPKMCVESAQMMASALRRHGATDEQMPLTKAGKPYKATHKNHPCTIWAGDCRDNFEWLGKHAVTLCNEYFKRFGKVHACYYPIRIMRSMEIMNRAIPKGSLTPFAQAMPDEYKDDDVVKAYRSYYKSKQYSKGGVRYVRADVPTWWEVTA